MEFMIMAIVGVSAEDYVVEMTSFCSDRFVGHSCESMIMVLSISFGKNSTANDFMNMLTRIQIVVGGVWIEAAHTRVLSLHLYG